MIFNSLKLIFLSLSFFFFNAGSLLWAQTCNEGELGWTEVRSIFMDNGCTNCHGGQGGFSLATYASFTQGGNKCGSAISQLGNLIGVITVDGYAGCNTSINGISMNKRTNGKLDSLELLLIERWINAGAPEICSNFCLNNENLKTTLTGANYYFEVNDTLTANNVIEANSNITYKAGDIIRLNNNFSVELGSEFHALIGTCEF